MLAENIRIITTFELPTEKVVANILATEESVCVWRALYNMASVSIPSVSIPSVSIPSVSIPSVSIPSVSIPSVSIPSVSIPSVSIPSVSIPSISIPSVSIPSVSIPSVSIPSVSIPSVSIPVKLFRLFGAKTVYETALRSSKCTAVSTGPVRDLTRFNKIAIPNNKFQMAKWTRKPLAYRESKFFLIFV